MDEPGREREQGAPLGEMFADVPLLREIQRVLLSSTGPVNWELARQIGIATAAWGRPDPPPSEEERRGLESTVRAAELHVSELTGLSQPADVAPVEVFRRAQWVEASIEGIRDLAEPAAGRVTEAFGRFQQAHGSSDAPALAQAMLPQVASLMLGAQAGLTLGELAKRALGQFDLGVPRSGPPAVFFVSSNIAALEQEWSLPPVEFRAWVALHEVVHRVEFSRPWVRGHFESLLRDHASSLELDLEGLARSMEDLDVSNPESLQGLLQSGQGLFGSPAGEEQRLKLARVQAFIGIAEGYAEHVSAVLGRRLLRSYPQIEEALRRRDVEDRDPLFAGLLGVEITRDLYRRGAEFCDRVVELTDEPTLARMWERADTLPSLPELEEPRLWLARNV